MTRTLIAIACLFAALSAKADNWDYIITHPEEYYFGTGTAATEKAASETALAELAGQIATDVWSEFKRLDDLTTVNGDLDHKSKVEMCVKTYTKTSLTNVAKMVKGKEPNITVLRYMKCSELARIFEGRIGKAKDMVRTADECLEKGKIDMALQYYYWAYSLTRSVQYPNEVTHSDGRVLVDWLPVRISEILDDIDVRFENRDGDYVDLLFDYKGKPVSSVEFTYSDGRDKCQGSAKDGRGMIEMSPGYETDVYHINIEYEYKEQARGDDEIERVLDVVTRRAFPKAVRKVAANKGGNASNSSNASGTAKASGSGNEGTGQAAATEQNSKAKADNTGIDLKAQPSQVVDNGAEYAELMQNVIGAISGRRYSDADRLFTIDGLDVYRKLIKYGTARVVGTPRLTFFKGANGTTVCRGLQMSFSFNSGDRKKTFVEDVVFTFDADKRIDNVVFGLGQEAESYILFHEGAGWTEESRELLMEFMENYKTAYCLKRLDYIRDIFADDARIIVGNLAKRRTTPSGPNERQMSIEGQQVIDYNFYYKNEYLEQLKRCFARNEFINIRFTHNDVQWLSKFDKHGETYFAIQIGQEYTSSTYSDIGHLFLLVDMSNQDEPQIKVRTWQPNEVPMDKRYNAGDFYKD